MSLSNSASVGFETHSERPLLTEFAELWGRGLADEEKLWQLFDLSEMYLHRPGYFGAPVFNTGGQLVTPVFSTPERLAFFMAQTGQIDLQNVDDGYDWVRVTGVTFFGLPIRARYLSIDPGTEGGVLVDLRSRSVPPQIANDAPPIAINLELLPDGTISGGPVAPGVGDDGKIS
ncbi:hypothetical protein [Rathayibacter toxicus]|uniref:SseB protein N-terminal domain-containing protein n=1 Tax=Rathayibacter toxicus TaxID=145458 RepID=A0A2S5Y9M6_9MICO|nr:hypothetical protein [Rathayibacter toxicus]PPH25322.1 hypothetical protein C5D17_01220 [Rathayibacter toxicus]PPH58568.1 hypothetical protein C5D30_01230 [Rathayibacter toxicus]PPH61122.1 hypothetical protein C5C93_01240 [Rathayibacter toxicus]PPH87981.1 hypothetical protein C5D31_04130 [Rathayibacter toxicus]PPI16731.1 hypothetical protein C5C51_01215 [Rathayibacter toxicus]